MSERRGRAAAQIIIWSKFADAKPLNARWIIFLLRIIHILSSHAANGTSAVTHNQWLASVRMPPSENHSHLEGTEKWEWFLFGGHSLVATAGRADGSPRSTLGLLNHGRAPTDSQNHYAGLAIRPPVVAHWALFSLG
jgi:hypothetical protein